MKSIRIISVILAVFFLLSCLTPAPYVDAEVEPVVEAESSASSMTDVLVAAEDEQADDYKPEAVSRQDAETEAAEIVLPPLSDDEFRSAVADMMPWNMSIVKDGTVPLAVIHDLDKNGYRDALVIAVEGDEPASLSVLSESARLFQSGREYSNFLLLIFYQYSGEVILRYTVPVSKQLVFTGVEPFEIRRDSDFPYALLFSFRTRAGIEQELIILSGYGITRFSIMENLSEITLIEDIDEDGYKDIIVHEQGFEEGTGFETFLTWYKWNSREYTEYRNTNIVRNLRQFYLVCAEYLRAGETAEFLEYALDSETLSALKKQGLSDTSIMESIFKPVDSPADGDGFFEMGGFSAVVFPEIMETPFSYANRMDFRHQVSVRFSRSGGGSRIYLAELNMKKNPFQNKQFCFTIAMDLLEE